MFREAKHLAQDTQVVSLHYLKINALIHRHIYTKNKVKESKGPMCI